MRGLGLGILLLLAAACGDSGAPATDTAPQAANGTLPPDMRGPGQPLLNPPPSPAVQPPPRAYNPFPPEEVQAAWKASLESDCAQDTPAATLASFDMTGDGKPERICWRVLKAEPVGEYLDIVVVHQGVGRQSAYILLPADGSVQQAVCPSDSYDIRPDAWTDAGRREVYGIPDVWPQLGLTISNDCDPVHLFWPPDADSFGDSEVLFFFARM